MKSLNEYARKAAMVFVLCLMSVVANAQNPNNVEMADAMRENGKINVVVGVLLIIMLGIFVYLFSLNKKIIKLEKELK